MGRGLKYEASKLFVGIDYEAERLRLCSIVCLLRGHRTYYRLGYKSIINKFKNTHILITCFNNLNDTHWSSLQYQNKRNRAGLNQTVGAGLNGVNDILG
jgi:hypothetical protein